MIGALVMTHGDDHGLRLPPALAPVQVAIVPIYRSEEEHALVVEMGSKIRDALAGNGIRVRLDDRDQHRPGFKFGEWELKGVPVRMEIGPRDVEADQVVVAKRTGGDKESLPVAETIAGMAGMLDGIQSGLYEEAKALRNANTHEAIDYASFVEGIASQSGFWVGSWCGDADCEQKVTADTKATIRILPVEREDPGAACLVCGRPGVERATWARAY